MDCVFVIFCVTSYASEALEPDWLIAAGAYPGFCSMKRLEVFLLPLDEMLVHRRSLPHNLFGFPNNSPVAIYTPGWREAMFLKEVFNLERDIGNSGCFQAYT